MASRVCPNCGALNSATEKRCFRCERPLPGPLLTTGLDLWTRALGREAPFTRLFVGLCALVFVFMTLASGKLELLGSGRPSEALRWGAIYTPLLGSEPWRYLSAAFVHFGVLHIGFNMMTLWDLGKSTEQRLGAGRFVLILLGTSVLGFVASHVWYDQALGRPAFTAGASAGLFGLIGTLVGYLYAARDPAWKQFLVRVAIYAAIFAVAFPVNNAAHVGGFLAGVPLGYLFYKEKRPWKRNAVFNVIAVVGVVASLASIGLSHASPAWKTQRALELASGG